MLIFELGEEADAGYEEHTFRRPGYLAEVLNALSPDFLDLENRAEGVADRVAEEKMQEVRDEVRDKLDRAREEVDNRLNQAREEVTRRDFLISIAATIATVAILAFNFAVLTSLSDVRADNAALKSEVTRLSNQVKRSAP